MMEIVKNEVKKLIDARVIYPISDSPWVSPIQVVPKKRGMTVVLNEHNELILMHNVTGWQVCIDYGKLNDTTCKDHFPLPLLTKYWNDFWDTCTTTSLMECQDICRF